MDVQYDKEIEEPGFVYSPSIFEVLSILAGDMRRVWRFGRNAPRFGQRLWIAPAEIDWMLTYPLPRHLSGQFRSGGWDQRVDQYALCPVLSMIQDRIWRGIEWENLAYFQRLLSLAEQEKSPSRRDYLGKMIRAKYHLVDQLIDEVKVSRRLKTCRELGGFREVGGVYVHIARDGSPVFGLAGRHRLAVASALRLPRIPVQLGVVHAELLRPWIHGSIQSRIKR